MLVRSFLLVQFVLYIRRRELMFSKRTLREYICWLAREVEEYLSLFKFDAG